MILTHGANSIERSSGGNTARIGDKDYRVAQMPDGKIWMCENLDFKFSGCVIGASGSSSSEARGNYFDNNESLWGWNGRKCGLLYNFPAVEFINNNRGTLCPGWHVPDSDEWSSLGASCNDTRSLCALYEDWMDDENWQGTDDYGFAAVPAGGFAYGSFYKEGPYFWTGTQYDYVYPSPYNSYFEIDYNEPFVQYPVRLVKDTI